jgi:hypothetical protein
MTLNWGYLAGTALFLSLLVVLSALHSRPIASTVIALFIVLCLLVLPQRAGQHPGQMEAA